jgi:(2Fe-2S) ferredoxin
MRNTMESKDGKLYNTMGSEVAEGFTCRPKDFDASKPIMHFKTQLFICDDERCGKAHKSDDKAADLREVIKELKLAKGENRIKIVRTGCFGACRFRSVANIYENTVVNGNVQNNAIWLKNVHRYDKEKWSKLFKHLSNNEKLDEQEFERVPMSQKDKYKYE